MKTSVKLKFPMKESTWNIVVVDTKEKIVDINERSDHFVVEYKSKKDARDAIARFDGVIDFKYY